MTNKKKIRHCMIVYKPYPHFEIRVKREAAALIDAGHSVDVICPRTVGDEDMIVHEGVTVYRTNMLWGNKSVIDRFLRYNLFLLLAAIKLVVLHAKNRFDVVQVHNIPDFLVFSAIYPKLTGAKVVLDLHDLTPEFFAGNFNTPLKGLLIRLIGMQERIACGFADHVITVTEHWRQTLIGRGVPQSKCSVVMNLADPIIFGSIADGVPKERGDNQLCLIYHGSIPERYGLDLVLKAMKQIIDEAPNIHFTLIGEGDHLEELISLAKELDLDGEHFRHVPLLLPTDLPKYIANADLAVVPYRDDVFTNTLLPTKLMEYAYVGKPAIASKTYGISKYFSNSMVMFFEPNDVSGLADCLLKFYNNRSLLEEYSTGIKEFNNQHNWRMESHNYVTRMVEIGNA